MHFDRRSRHDFGLAAWSFDRGILAFRQPGSVSEAHHHDLILARID
jgi:hypothetical protein